MWVLFGNNSNEFAAVASEATRWFADDVHQIGVA